jgi:uncharacterized protein (TIGR00730 family)
MYQNICVFCSSSDQIDSVYFELAKELAYTIAKNRQTLIFGGSNVGLMKQLADNVKLKNGKIIGVIPEKIKRLKSTCETIDELIVTPDMHTRKEKLVELADVFIALPGGFGTLDELSDVLALKQLDYHRKPVILLNVDGFYDHLINFFQTCYDQQFSRENPDLYYVAENVSDCFEYMDSYGHSREENV